MAAQALADKTTEDLKDSLEKASRYIDADEHRLAAQALLKLGADALQKARKEIMNTANYEGKRGHEEERERLISLAAVINSALQTLKEEHVDEEPTL